MQTTGSYKKRQSTDDVSRTLLGSVLYALLIGMVVVVILILLLSLTEWLIPNAEKIPTSYIADAIPFIGIGLGTYCGSRRLGRRVVWLGVISGLIYWLLALCMIWCLDIAVTSSWLMISVALCIGTALIGAMAGLLRTR